MARTSERSHWEKFWSQKKDPSQIYDTSGRIVAALSEFVPDLNGKWIVEIGAGTGRDSFTLAESGANVVVLDYADAAMEIIKNLNEKSRAKVLPVQGDAFALPFPDNSFDVVFHQGLLEHFRDPSGILKENYRVLKPGGIAIIDVPQRWHIYTVVKHILIALDAWFAGWETEFSLGQLENILRQHGFEPIGFYGDWMYPSFFYRALREILWKFGIKLPLYPFKVPVFWKLRKYLREKLRRKRLFCYTTLSIGVIARKPDTNEPEKK